MESELVEIHYTAESLDEVRKLARRLIQEKLVACAQIIPWIESVYLWNGAIETAQETKLVLKTRRQLFQQVAKVLQESSRYEVPEITLIPIQEANPPYRNWLLEATETLS